jgi:hypothetical protein
MGSPLPAEFDRLAGSNSGAARSLRNEADSGNLAYRRKLFVVAGASFGELQGFVRGNCIPQEVDRMPEIASSWKRANSAYRTLQITEQSLPKQVALSSPEPELGPLLESIAAQPLFRSSYGEHDFQVMKVGIRNLIACQRHVDLDYVDTLSARLLENVSSESIARFCLLSPLPLHPPKQLQISPNAFCFSSPNTDFRFLGGYVRPVSDADTQTCWMGGQPAAMVILMLGYGAPSMNAFQIGDRVVLSNGFHRAYTLLSSGVEHAYLVVRRVNDPSTELPPVLGSMSNDCILNNPRPILVRDFFNPSLISELRGSPGLRNIQVAWQASQVNIPL